MEDRKKHLEFLAKQAQELNMGYDMSKIKTPQEFYIENREEHLKKTIGTSDFCQSMMKAYHEYAMKAELEAVIAELEKRSKYLYKYKGTDSYVQRCELHDIIEILKSRI